MSSNKQVIVMRNDLNMRKGKMVAQGAHASLKAILDHGSIDRGEEGLGGYQFPDGIFTVSIDKHLKGWLDGQFKKICVRVDSEEELLAIVEKCKEAKIPTALITDNGLTEFNGVPTNTCCAVGPADETVVNAITGHLKLL
jgi:PTH2 family peptidyl-tRNA hydrolase